MLYIVYIANSISIFKSSFISDFQRLSLQLCKQINSLGNIKSISISLRLLFFDYTSSHARSMKLIFQRGERETNFFSLPFHPCSSTCSYSNIRTIQSHVLVSTASGFAYFPIVRTDISNSNSSRTINDDDRKIQYRWIFCITSLKSIDFGVVCIAQFFIPGICSFRISVGPRARGEIDGSQERVYMHGFIEFYMLEQSWYVNRSSIFLQYSCT